MWRWDYVPEKAEDGILDEVLLDAEDNVILSIDGDEIEGYYIKATEGNKRLIAAAPALYGILNAIIRELPLNRDLERMANDLLAHVEGRK